MTHSAAPESQSIPPLENGDRLTRYEFERRYAHMPHQKKAELVEGVVYMPAALRHRQHGKPHAAIIGWLVAYQVATPGVDVGDNSTVRLDPDNEPQPDALLRIEEVCGGQSRIGDDDYIERAPELIVEIAASSVAYDLYDKLNAYRRNGVQEYLVWLVRDREFRWYQLQAGRYALQAPNPDGVLTSTVFPGLWLAVEPLLSGHLAAVFQILQQGIATPMHSEFVQRLQSQEI